MFANRAIKSANVATKFANNSRRVCEYEAQNSVLKQ
jgi:hypothetical protein